MCWFLHFCLFFLLFLLLSLCVLLAALEILIVLVFLILFILFIFLVLFTLFPLLPLLTILQSSLLRLDVINHDIHVSSIPIDLVDIVDLLHWVDIHKLLLEFEAVEMKPICGVVVLSFLVVG